MLLDSVTPQVPISLPPTERAPSARHHRSDLRVCTGSRSPLYHPAPRLHSQLEGARTAPLLLNPPPPRRAFSHFVDGSRQPAPSPTPPLRTRPGQGHKRKISDKLKSIFQVHVRQASEPTVEPSPSLFDMPIIPPFVAAAKPTHRRNESAPDGRVAQWVQQQSATFQSPPRPRRSPGTASFVVSSFATEFTFPRYTQDNTSTPSLYSNNKSTAELRDEDDLYEPITAALYPNGKGLLGTTQRRARTERAQPEPDMFRFDKSSHLISKSKDEGDDSPPAYMSSEHSDEDDFSDFAHWYVGPN